MSDLLCEAVFLPARDFHRPPLCLGRVAVGVKACCTCHHFVNPARDVPPLVLRPATTYQVITIYHYMPRSIGAVLPHKACQYLTGHSCQCPTTTFADIWPTITYPGPASTLRECLLPSTTCHSLCQHLPRLLGYVCAWRQPVRSCQDLAYS